MSRETLLAACAMTDHVPSGRNIMGILLLIAAGILLLIVAGAGTVVLVLSARWALWLAAAGVTLAITGGLVIR